MFRKVIKSENPTTDQSTGLKEIASLLAGELTTYAQQKLIEVNACGTEGSLKVRLNAACEREEGPKGKGADFSTSSS